MLNKLKATWTYSLEFLKAKAARDLRMGMSEFDQMSKNDKAIPMALIAAEGWMRAVEEDKARKSRA
ncbi:unnamed protein product [marine sediment metagenome]|uniref:Uncharacterized protein n=1 Tax=marine sediment metagenome TaxID=412755 RepID=X0YI38_9ZZZZ